MTQKVECRRRTRRHAIPAGREARIEFSHPAPGGPDWRFALADLSVAGLSFVMGEDAPDIEGGTNLSEVVVRVADCEIHGDLLIMHVTAESPARVHCGALFYPASDLELVKLKSVVAGIEAVQPD